LLNFIALKKPLQKQSEELICKVAKTIEEAVNLMESGFEYVCEIQG